MSEGYTFALFYGEKNMDIQNIISSAPNNFVIRDALVKCFEVIQEHDNICCSVSGGSDSDVMLDMMIRCGAKTKTKFVFRPLMADCFSSFL